MNFDIMKKYSLFICLYFFIAWYQIVIFICDYLNN